MNQLAYRGAFVKVCGTQRRKTADLHKRALSGSENFIHKDKPPGGRPQSVEKR